jgi:proton-dependent oligopeptide transporter, POT family
MSDTAPTEPMGLKDQLKSFNRIFWIGNLIEMVERLAYYGLRVVVPLYIVLAIEEGGPQFSQTQKGMIFAIWAAIQSFVPILTGGYADKFGYKLTVAVSTVIKIAGYLSMAYALEIASFVSGGASVGVPGHSTTLVCFTVGAGLLALGTAVFKPGIQGIIALQLKEANASVGWSVFYQLVNVGGFLGPYVASVMRLMAWRYVFIACAVIISFNFLLLLAFPEPKRELSTADIARGDAELDPSFVAKFGRFLKVLWDGTIGIFEPRLAAFLVVFSGFWAMFHQLFDLLPNYISDWVDTSMVTQAIVAPLFSLFGSTIPAEWAGQVPPEQMINLNAGMCMLLAFIIGFYTGKVRSMTAMIAGILVSAGAIYSLGLSTNGWITLTCIAAFSLGELMSSPTKMRYFASIAPPGKKATYLGYVNATGGIGWALGSLIAGAMYEEGGDKVVLARRYLTDTLGQDATAIGEMAKTEVMPHLAAATDQTVMGAQTMLYNHYDPSFVWTHFAIIGLVSMLGLIIFDQVTRRTEPKVETPILIVLTGAISYYTYGLVPALVFVGGILLYLGLQKWAPQTLPEGQTS